MKITVNEIEYTLNDNFRKGIVSLFKIACEKMNMPEHFMKTLAPLEDCSAEELANLVARIKDEALSFYHGISTPKRLAGIALSRGLIAHMESKIDNYEARKLLRPPRKVDPIDHLLALFQLIVEVKILPDILEELSNAIIEISTEDNIVKSICFTKSTDRSTLVAHGNNRKWEDICREDD